MNAVGDALGKNPDVPPAPNYVGAAQADAQTNHPNIFTPFGSQVWSNKGNKYTANLSMSPELQALWKASIGSAGSTLSKPLDITANRDAITDAMYRRSTRLLDPQYAQRDENMKAELVNKGFSVGDEGYDRAVGNFDRTRDEAYADARDRAMTGGSQQAISEALAERQVPMQELAQIHNFLPFTGAPTSTGTLDATKAAGQYAGDIYNAQVGQQNQQLATGGQLAMLAYLLA